MSILLVSKLVEYSGRPNEFGYKFLLPALRTGSFPVKRDKVRFLAHGLYPEENSPFTSLVFTNSKGKGISLSVDITSKAGAIRKGIYFGKGRYKIETSQDDIDSGFEKFGGVKRVHPVSGTISTNVRLPRFAVRFPGAELDEEKGAVRIRIKDSIWESCSGFSNFGWFLFDLTHLVNFLNKEMTVEELIAKTNLYCGANSFFAFHRRVAFFDKIWKGGSECQVAELVKSEFNIDGESVEVKSRILAETIERLNAEARKDMQSLLDRAKAKAEQKELADGQTQTESDFTRLSPLPSQERQ